MFSSIGMSRYHSRPLTWAFAAALMLSLVALWLLIPLMNSWNINAGHDFLLLYAAPTAWSTEKTPSNHTILPQQAPPAGIPSRYLLADGRLNQPYVYPPLFAWLVSPLTNLAPQTALFAWRLLSAASVFLGT